MDGSSNTASEVIYTKQLMIITLQVVLWDGRLSKIRVVVHDMFWYTPGVLLYRLDGSHGMAWSDS